MKIKEKLQGTIILRLLTIFVISGVVPAVIIAGILVAVLNRQNQSMVADLDQQLQLKAERSLLGLTNDRAERYNQFFKDQAHNASQVADFLAQRLETSDGGGSDSWELKENIFRHPSGWWVNGSKPDMGFLMSPEAILTPDLEQNQSFIAGSKAVFTSLSNANPEIRTVFAITEDQTLWIYPNRLWQDGQFMVAELSDLSNRPYYQETEQVVWANPYVDVEPVLTVAAPIWVGEDFYGMAGVDFSLETLITETLETRIGSNGYMFLVDEDAQVVALPDLARGSLLREDLSGCPAEMIGLSLFEVVPEQVDRELQSAGLHQKLSQLNPFLLGIEIQGEPTYVAFSPLESVPWYVAVVQPADEVTQFASEVQSQVQKTSRTILMLSVATGLGFILVILIGGVITYRHLVHPIQDLATGAREISQGNLDYRVPVEWGETELSRLTETFNVMASSVQTMQEEIIEQEEVLADTLTRREREFTALTELTALLNRQEDLPKIFSQVLGILQDVIEVDLAALSLVEENSMVSYTVQTVLPTIDTSLINQPACEVHISSTLIRRVIQSRHLLSIEDMDDLVPDIPEEKVRCFQEAGIKTVYLIPVTAGSRVLAVLTLMWIQPPEIDDQLWGFIEPVLKHLALLIEHNQLRHQSRDYAIIEERRRMARELHDSVTQSLFTLRLLVEGLEPEISPGREDLREHLGTISQQVETIQGEMRRLINELRPIQLLENNFRTALDRHLNSLRTTTGLEVYLDTSGPLKGIPQRMAENLNRIIQEAFHNIAQHAAAARVEVDVAVGEDLVTLRINDDGRGFDFQEVSLEENQSLGLLSMRERAEMLGGVLLIRSQPGVGTELTVKLPL